MSQDLRGVVHGKWIQLDESPDLPDGQAVTVSIAPVAAPGPGAPGEGLRRSAGGWSDDPRGLDEFMEWNRRQRRIGRAEIEP